MYFGVARCRLIPNKNNNNRLESFMALDDYDFNLAAYLHVRKRFRYRYICIYVCVRLHNLFINCIIVISIASAFNAEKKKWPPTERCWSSWRFSFFFIHFPLFFTVCIFVFSLLFFCVHNKKALHQPQHEVWSDSLRSNAKRWRRQCGTEANQLL